MPDVSLGLVLFVASASIFGPLCGWLAGQRRRNVALWGIFGVILGPIAPGLLMSAPPGRCAACRWPVGGWGARCVACGADVRTGAPAPADSEPPVRQADESAAHAVAGASERPTGARRKTVEKSPRATRTRTRRGPSRTATGPEPPPLTIVPGPNRQPAGAEHDWSSRVPATRLGRRPVDPPAVRPPTPVPRELEDRALAILGSGVYVGGNRPIQAGNRYLLARVADELQLLGPVHLDPGAVADRMPIQAIEAFVLEGRLVIGSRDAKTDISMAFVSVSREREVDIVAALGGPESAASAQ